MLAWGRGRWEVAQTPKLIKQPLLSQLANLPLLHLIDWHLLGVDLQTFTEGYREFAT